MTISFTLITRSRVSARRPLLLAPNFCPRPVSQFIGRGLFAGRTSIVACLSAIGKIIILCNFQSLHLLVARLAFEEEQVTFGNDREAGLPLLHARVYERIEGTLVTLVTSPLQMTSVNDLQWRRVFQMQARRSRGRTLCLKSRCTSFSHSYGRFHVVLLPTISGILLLFSGELLNIDGTSGKSHSDLPSLV